MGVGGVDLPKVPVPSFLNLSASPILGEIVSFESEDKGKTPQET